VPQNGNGADLAAPGTDAGPTKVNVQFVVPEYLTHWGQVLKVVGSMDELGNWKVEKVRSSTSHIHPSARTQSAVTSCAPLQCLFAELKVRSACLLCMQAVVGGAC
jgi:hypothetical protein